MTLHAGLQHAETIIVSDALTVPAVSDTFTGFGDMPPVFATAYLVGFVEWTCIELLRPHLASGEHSVGTHIDISHSAATPVGMEVTANVELIEVDARKLRFRVCCNDAKGPIGEGFHERALIDVGKFMARVKAKRAFVT